MFALPAMGQSVSELFAAGGRVRGIVVPIYDKREMTNVAVVRVERIYTGHERKGFFQIGVLPVEILEGVAIEMTQPSRLTNSLDRIGRWMTPKKTSRIEIRHARLEAGSENWLEAGRVRISEAGTWDLLEGVTLCQGTNMVKSPQGKFHLTGDQAGVITMVTFTNEFVFSGPERDRR